MEKKKIKAALVLPNDGQIEGLPRNPRQWSERELRKLKESIQGTPELVEMRAPIVVRHGGYYVAVGGNMRLQALKESGAEHIECIVLPDGMPVAKLKEIALKDNTQFGQWDVDALANEWDDMPLADWGVREKFRQEEKNDMQAPKDGRVVVEIELEPDEFYFVQDRLRDMAQTAEDALLILLGYGAPISV